MALSLPCMFVGVVGVGVVVVVVVVCVPATYMDKCARKHNMQI